MFRTDASASTCFHSSKDKQLYAITGFSISIRNIVYLWVQFIKLILAVGSGAFFYELLTEGTRKWTGAAYTVETDIEKLVDLMIERIEEKRTALGI